MNKKELTDYLVKKAKDPEPYIRTAIPALNKFIDGMYPGTIIGIGAWPGHGKTTLVMNLMAGLQGQKVSVFDTEMSKYRYMEKFVSLLTETPHEQIRTNLSGCVDDLISKLSVLDKYNIHIIDLSSPSIQDIETEIKTNLPRVVIIDYFQNIFISNPMNRYGEYTGIARKLEDLAKKYQCTMVVLSQFKKPESGVSKPTIFDFKETGKLAEMFHVALLLGRDGDNMVIDVAKNRDGLIGEFKVQGNWQCNKLLK